MDEEKILSVLKSAKGNVGKSSENLDLEDPGVMKAFADAARSQEIRELILDSLFFNHIELNSPMSADLMVELCRLYGNLCFNNGKGRELVRSTQVLEKLYASLQSQPSVITQSKLITVLPAFLQNFCIDNSSNINLVSSLLTLISEEVATLNKQETDEFSFLEDFVLVLLEDEEGREFVFQPLLRVSADLIRLGGSSPNTDLISTLVNTAETETFSKIMLQYHLHRTLMQNLEKDVYSTKPEDEDKTDKELCSDLLVMTLSDATPSDVDITLLKKWIRKGSQDVVLSSTGLLILGNLCTSDQSIDQLISDEVLADFFALLGNNNEKIRHSLLGCLRNCCVNLKIRNNLQSRGLDSELIELSKSEGRPETLVKTVTVLRLLSLSNQDTCRKIGSDDNFLRKIVQTGRNSASFSPTIGQLNVEFARLCSTVMTQCRSDHVTDQLVSAGCLLFVVSLLNSSHPVMVNQAVLPLCLVFAGRPVPTPAMEVVTVDMLNQLAKALDHQLIPGEVKQNLVKLVDLISALSEEEVKDTLSASQISCSLRNYSRKLEEIRQGNSDGTKIPETHNGDKKESLSKSMNPVVVQEQVDCISTILSRI